MNTDPRAPTGLDLGQTIAPEAARAQATLPGFGAFCSRAAVRLGLESTALASAGQKPWLEAAKSIFAAMAAGGAPVGSYRFVAHDERKAMAWMDSAFAVFNRDPIGHPKTMLTNREVRRTHADGSRSRWFAAGSLHDKQWGAAFEKLSSFFDKPAHARALGIGHEFGHAWQSAMNRPMHQAASEGLDGPVAEDLRARSDRLSRWDPPAPKPNKSAAGPMVYEMIEESVCDAIGCWAAQKTHGVNILRAVQRFRTGALDHGDPRYNTRWLLGMLERSHPVQLPESFDELAAAIEACIRKAAPLLTGNFLDGGSKKPRP